MVKPKFYSVQHGRDGPKIYNSWSQCEKAVKGWSRARHKSFVTKEAAEAWLNTQDGTFVEIDAGSPLLTISDPQTSHQSSHLPETSPNPSPRPSSSLNVAPFTNDFIPLPGSPDGAKSSSWRSTASFTLSDEQHLILGLAKQGKHIFFTGSAGTGKSVLLGEIIEHLGGRESDSLAITASTGIAAVNIGGVTLHSWAGIGLGIGKVDKLIDKVKSNKYSQERWRRTQILIIDEISMVDGVLFDKLDHISRDLRDCDLPFGGIQLILSGDFCQLPPVPDRHGNAICFAFEAGSWKRCFGASGMGTAHRLTKVFRQRDEALIDMLNSLRHGQPDARISALFEELSRPIQNSDGLGPCELFPLRDQVHKANESRLRRLDGELLTFEASDVAGFDIYNRPVSLNKAKQLLNRLVAPEISKLKIGAQVMLIKNLAGEKLVNGSIGQVIAFQSLAKAQGLHMEIAKVDKSKGVEQRKQDNQEEPPTEKPEQEVYVDRMWPVVRFLNGKTLLLTPVEFEVVNVYGRMEACRIQVPLILAWALSIHKSQGQTLERVRVDLARVFETGQAYVALSRATCLTGLQVLNFHPSKVMAHPRVLEYYKRLDEKHASQMTPSIQPAAQAYDEFDEFDDEVMASYYAAGLGDEGEYPMASTANWCTGRA